MTPARPDAPPEGRRYHHGDLPKALKAAAVDLISERGAAGFSLREVARRAGVSHAAPAHHFGDSAGLLTALAADGLQALYEALSAAAEGATSTAERVEAVSRAYVTVALAHPAHWSLMFRTDLIDGESQACRHWGDLAYGELLATIEAVRRDHNPDLDVPVAASLCWSAMQGLVELHPRMASLVAERGGDLGPIDDLAARFARLLLDGFRC